MTQNSENPKTTTAGGQKIFPSNLLAINSGHDEYIIVDRVTLTILCWTERRGFGVINYPIKFRGNQSAQNWINSGSIADLQEEKNCLAIGFTDRLIE